MRFARDVLGIVAPSLLVSTRVSKLARGFDGPRDRRVQLVGSGRLGADRRGSFSRQQQRRLQRIRQF
jgi:hypothetical protein